MVRFTPIKVVLLDSTILVYKNATLKEVVTDLLSKTDKKPILIKLGKHNSLYFNEEIFTAWLQKEITLDEVLQDLKVNSLVRNKETLIIENTTVEANSLWLVKSGICVLADIDQFIGVKIDNRFKLYLN